MVSFGLAVGVYNVFVREANNGLLTMKKAKKLLATHSDIPQMPVGTIYNDIFEPLSKHRLAANNDKWVLCLNWEK